MYGWKAALTANGKLDRRALPAPEADAYVQAEYEEPQGETERALAGIWAELLGLDPGKVGRRDNFFRVGWTFVCWQCKLLCA